MSTKVPCNFSWVIEGLLAGCAYPNNLGHFRYFVKHGIRHLVNLTDYPAPAHLIPKELRHHHIPVPEFDAPTLDQMIQFTRLVNTAKQNNEAIVVHCFWGRGRTGTMLAASLVNLQGMAPDDAISEIRRLRPYSVETYEQEEAVHLYSLTEKASSDKKQPENGHQPPPEA